MELCRANVYRLEPTVEQAFARWAGACRLVDNPRGSSAGRTDGRVATRSNGDPEEAGKRACKAWPQHLWRLFAPPAPPRRSRDRLIDDLITGIISTMETFDEQADRDAL